MGGETAVRRARPGAKKIPSLDPLEQLLAAMAAVGDGDFSVQLPGHWEGIAGKLAENFNEIVSHNRRLANDLAQVGEKVGRMGDY